MKNQKMKETLRQISKKAGALVLATAIVLGGGTYVYNQQNPVPELVTYIDEDSVVQIQEDETPLASPKVTKSTKTTKSTKKISLKSAASKTYAQKGKTTTKKKTTKTKSAKKTVTTVTVTVTSITNNYKKGSKINTQVTTVKTTVTKTTVTNTAAPVTTPVTDGTVAVTQIAPAADKRVLNAFQKLGFQVVIQSNVPYSGLCDAETRTITLKQADETVYHELGHFLAFIAGLQGVDRHLYEAGAVDGIKNRWQELWYITLPSMKSMLMFGAVQAITGAFGFGAIVDALCGNPSVDYCAWTLTHHLNEYMTTRFEFGYASAISLVLFLLCFGSNIAVQKFLSKVGQ